MPFKIIRNNITKLKVDAIVNAANTELIMGGGVRGAIFNTAGADELQRACNKLAPIKTGEAVITPGFNLPAKYIIHTAGPVYHDGKQNEENLLRSCYINSLKIAHDNQCQSIAFPLISSGIYRYPKAEALHVATSAILGFLSEYDIDVSLVVFDKTAVEVSEKLLGEVERYIDENYVEEIETRYARREYLKVEEEAIRRAEMINFSMQMPCMPEESLVDFNDISVTGNIADLIGNLDESFTTMLLRLIDSTGKKDSEIYNRANIDRRLFSKIRSNENYSPSKPTVLAFAIALELTLSQTKDLLEHAGFALSNSRKLDVIVEYFIKSKIYDIYEINEVLFMYDQPLLGG